MRHTVIVAILIVVAMLSPRAEAEVLTWIGGTPNIFDFDSIHANTNWNPNKFVDTNGNNNEDTLLFDSNATTFDAYSHVGVRVDSIIFDATLAQGFTIHPGFGGATDVLVKSLLTNKSPFDIVFDAKFIIDQQVLQVTADGGDIAFNKSIVFFNFNGSTPGLLVDGKRNVTIIGGASAVGAGGDPFTLTKNGSGMLSLNGGTYDIPGGTTVNGGTLMGDGSLLGLLEVNAGGRVAPGNSIGTLGVANFLLNSGATLEVEIDRDEKQQSDLVEVTNDATLEAGSTVAVSVIGVDLQVNDLFTIITTAAGITDNGVIIDAPGRYGIIGQINGNNYELLVQTVAEFVDFIERVSNSNQRIGAALDELRTNDADNALIELLDGLTDAQVEAFARQVADGVRVPNILANVSVETTQAYNTLLSQYLASARNGTRQLAMQPGYRKAGTQLASLDLNPAALEYAIAAMYANENQKPVYQPLLPDRTSEWSAYAKTYGIYSNQDSGTNRTGYRSDSFGFQTGFDRQFGEKWIAGITGGYTNTDADLDGGLGSLDVDSLRIGPYATYSADGGRWFVDLAATYGYHKTDANRLAAGTNADADYDSHDLTLYVGGGYNFAPIEKLRITPVASLQYQYFHREDYTESGPGAIAFSDSDTSTLYSRLGIQVGYRIDVGNIILVPELTVGWEHEWLDENETINASFVGGGAFSIDSSAPEQDSIFFGAGLTSRLNDTTSLFLRYEGSSNSDGNVHGIEAGLRLWF